MFRNRTVKLMSAAISRLMRRDGFTPFDDGSETTFTTGQALYALARQLHYGLMNSGRPGEPSDYDWALGEHLHKEIKVLRVSRGVDPLTIPLRYRLSHQI